MLVKKLIESYEVFFFHKTFFENKLVPDLILIDGRFRVCCFLSSLKYGNVGTKILFDDYLFKYKSQKEAHPIYAINKFLKITLIYLWLLMLNRQTNFDFDLY